MAVIPLAWAKRPAANASSFGGGGGCGSFLSLAWAGQVAVARLTAKIHYSLLEVVVNPTDPTLAIWRGPR